MCNTEARSRNHCYSGKETSIIYSECVSVAIVIQYATGMSVLYSHMSSVWLYHIFPHYFVNGTIFEAMLLNIKCFDFVYNVCLKNLFLSRIQRDIIINVRRSARNVPVILDRFYWNWNILDRFSKILTYQISWKSIQWEPSCSMRTDRQIWWN